VKNAVAFKEKNEPLVLVEKEDPKATVGKIVIDMKVAGHCHSDVGVLKDPGWKALLGELPVIMGHEVAGVISEVGEGVKTIKLVTKWLSALLVQVERLQVMRMTVALVQKF